MNRKALGLFLGISLAFAALPALAAFSFAGSPANEDVELARVPVTVVDVPATGASPLALGVGADSKDCPGDTSDASLF